MGLAILIIVILVAAAVSVVLLANRARSSTGSLSRETRRRDRGAPTPSDAPELSTSTEIEAAGRERADDTRSRLGGALARRRAGEVVEYDPVDEEELGVTRRQFFNRAILIAVGFSVAGFLPAMLAFLWPFRATGFGGKVKVDKSLPDIISYVQTNRQPYYVPLARPYPL